MKRLANYAQGAAAVFVVCALTELALPAQTFTTLFSFNNTNGANPYSPLVLAANGGLYGTTKSGGTYASGTVLKIQPGGALTTLYNFCSQTNCMDGGGGTTGLVQASNGYLYGTTLGGGVLGFGTVFKITPSGILTTLYSFCSQTNCADGYVPSGGLVQAANGDFYGTTVKGGANNQGTVFKISPAGTLTTLYSFCSLPSCADGMEPENGLVQATNGDLYGTTGYGGANHDGTIFRITLSGAMTTVYNFCSVALCADGSYPTALIQARDGNLYGATDVGGVSRVGTVFKITLGGKLTTLYSFCRQLSCPDGSGPNALVQATDGNFYGTTYTGGLNDYGTVFELTPSGKLTTLHSFCMQGGCPDGAHPAAALVQDTNGTLYGSTSDYLAVPGTYGTVFSLSVGLGPFVEPSPSSGKIGSAVKILGTNLPGTTSVTFNGTAATFKVASRTLITTTVPAGATTGKIQVVTPSGTLSSNVRFRVLP